VRRSPNRLMKGARTPEQGLKHGLEICEGPESAGGGCHSPRPLSLDFPARDLLLQISWPAELCGLYFLRFTVVSLLVSSAICFPIQLLILVQVTHIV
jgi:hypothetical protein